VRHPGGSAQPAPVAIVGAGPVGLSLALGLARQGVPSVLLERHGSVSERSKAPAIHVRTREIFRLWRVEDRFVNAGFLAPSLTLHSVVPSEKPLYTIDFSGLVPEAERPGLLLLEQGETEKLLLQAVRETGLCDVRFGHEATGLEQQAGGVRLTVREAREEYVITAAYVVGCDGAGSFVRETLDLPFDGMTYSLHPMLADVRVDDDRNDLPWPRLWNGARQLAFAVRLPSGLWRLVAIARDAPTGEGEIAPEEVLACVRTLLGNGSAEIVWSSRFSIHKRSSPRFRVGRVLLAGDAAHVHSPAGGFGMNGGIHDAHNLAWKIAAVLAGGDEDRLLESYDIERRAVIVERVSRASNVLTRTVLDVPASVRRVAFFAFRMAMRVAPIRSRMLRRIAMLDLDYPASPLLDPRDRASGKRLPNPLLRAPDGTRVRLYHLLSDEATLLDVSQDRRSPAILPLATLHIGQGGYADTSGLLRELLGGRDGWILVRPDAHIAWARHERGGMEEALARALGKS
jgi:2-polyprenyl-6-methoxyphenol hydroxylase-like FAD-dependent oxidoreductase